jgi:hypothetical protein
MRKLAAFAAAAMIAAVFIGLPILAIAAFAQDVIIAPTPSPWASFWAAIQAPLLAFVTAVLGALGVAIAGVVRKKFGAEAELAFNQVYRIAMDAAAGWLAARIAEGRVIDDALVNEAVDYATRSYPEVQTIEPRLANIAEDILAAFGRLKAKV